MERIDIVIRRTDAGQRGSSTLVRQARNVDRAEFKTYPTLSSSRRHTQHHHCRCTIIIMYARVYGMTMLLILFELGDAMSDREAGAMDATFRQRLLLYRNCFIFWYDSIRYICGTDHAPIGRRSGITRVTRDAATSCCAICSGHATMTFIVWNENAAAAK